MVIALPYKTDVDSQSKLTLSWLYWKFTMFNSSTFHKKKKKVKVLVCGQWVLHSMRTRVKGFTASAAGGTLLSHCG